MVDECGVASTTVRYRISPQQPQQRNHQWRSSRRRHVLFCLLNLVIVVLAKDTKNVDVDNENLYDIIDHEDNKFTTTTTTTTSSSSSITEMMIQQIVSHHDYSSDRSSTNHHQHSSTTNTNTNIMNSGGLIWNHLSVSTTTSTATSSGMSNKNDESHDHHHSQHTSPPPTILLHDTSGMVPNGHVVGIIGPSGSGKTILLHTLLQSSSTTSSSSTTTNQSPHYGTVYQYQYCYHHHPQKNHTITFQTIPSKQIAYISQNDHDIFFDQLTVYETLQLASFLESMSTTTDGRTSRASSSNSNSNDPNNMIQQTINQLGLQHVTHHKIGTSSSSTSSSTSSHSVTFSIMVNVNRWISSIVSFPKRCFEHFVTYVLKYPSESTHRTNKTATTSTTPNTKRRHSSAGRLSGGERRRLSVGLELVSSDKKLLLADEPTSGLDSTYSRIVMTLLRTLAQTRNIPAMIALHQPSSYIWNHILDYIILLAPGGYVCYNGRRDRMIPYFTQIGYPVPEYTNPSEFFLELVSIHTENTTHSILDQERIRHLYTTFQQYQQEQLSSSSKDRITALMQQNKIHASFLSSSSNPMANTTTTTTTNTEKSNRPLQQRLFTSIAQLPFIRSSRRIAALFRRSWRQNIRDGDMNRSRLLVSIGNAFLLAGVFPSIKKGSRPLISSIADRVALLSFGTINLCMMTYLKTITLFAHERPIVQRELNMRQQYSVFEYLIAKVTSELPIDMIFSLLFAVILKHTTGLQISIRQLSQVFALLTTAGASLGFLLGSTATSYQQATISGIPVLVILMVVGVINPSGVDVSKPQPLLLRYLKQISPFAYAIEALCIGEYRGVQFYAKSDNSQNGGGGGGRFGNFVSRLKDAPRMGGLAMITTGDEVLNALGMKHQTYKAAMIHLAWISFGNLVCTWLGLLWKERQQRRQYATTNKGGLPKPPPLPQTQVKSESSNPKHTAPIHVPLVART